jgi:D-3-phosphoglycerate dehydrogenase
MIPFVDRFKPVFEKYDMELIVPDVRERMEEADLLRYAGQFDGAICGDDRYTERVIQLCTPRLKVISKWGTGVDSIDAEACSRYGVKLCRTLCRLPILCWDTCWPSPAASPGWTGR